MHRHILWNIQDLKKYFDSLVSVISPKAVQVSASGGSDIYVNSFVSVVLLPVAKRVSLLPQT